MTFELSKEKMRIINKVICNLFSKTPGIIFTILVFFFVF